MEGEITSKLERQEALSPLQATYCEKLRVLFDLINRGSQGFGIDKDALIVAPTTEVRLISGMTASWRRSATIGSRWYQSKGWSWASLVLLSH